MVTLSYKLTAVLISCVILVVEGKKIPCPALSLSPGAVISCELPKEQRKIPCTGPINGVPKGTKALYKCEGETDFPEDNIVECKCYGRWKGLEAFEQYVSACNTVQKKFSLNGPPELNLTKEEIQLLGGNLTSSVTDGNVAEYMLNALAFHNFYRKRHGASQLVLNDTLSKSAEEWAEQEVESNHFGPEPWSANKTFISNLYQLTIGRENFDPVAAVRLAVGRWYGGQASYNYDVPVASAFSAMLWNGTSDLGVGMASKGGKVLIVCNYFPPGNVYVVGGEDSESSLILFKKNVFPLLSNYTTSQPQP